MSLPVRDVLRSMADTVECAIHTILCLRGVYPARLFTTVQRHGGVEVRQARHPVLCEYIAKAVTSIHAQLIAGTLTAIHINLLHHNPRTKRTTLLERYVLRIRESEAWQTMRAQQQQQQQHGDGISATGPTTTASQQLSAGELVALVHAPVTAKELRASMVALLLRVVTATAALPSLREVARDKGAEVTGSGTGTATSKSNDLDTRSEDMDDDDWLLDQITWSLCVCTSDDGVDPNHVDGGRREQQHQHHQEVQGTPMWIVDDDDGCMDRSDDVHASSQQQQPHKTFLPLRSADHGAVQWALHVES